MTDISRVALFGKLNPVAYRAIESATTFCRLRGNPYVELSHWIHQVLQLQDSDLHRIVREFDLDPARIARDLTAALDGLPRGATAVSDLSAHVEEAVERAWVYATLLFGESQVRTGHLLVGALKTRGLAHALTGLSSEFERVPVDALTERFAAIVAGSPESALGAHDGSRVDASGAGEAGGDGPAAEAALGRREALGRYATDLTARARAGEIDPIVGRDEEIRRIVDILMRRRQNNPILTGEAGVGKTAVVEGLARRIALGDVPPALRDVSLLTLDIGLLQAGAGVKGEFENRLRQVIEEVQSSPSPIILFVDEAHTLIGAGGAAGTGDAANLLKPALARGTLRTIAATTWAEYKKHIEKDPALTRRFQVVKIEEPGESNAVQMMRAIAATLEAHHRVQILDEGLDAAVRLSHRYIPDRQLPDKAVSLLDTACARVAVGQHAVPAEVEDARRRIEALETEGQIVRRERAVGVDDAGRAAAVDERLAAERARLGDLETRWGSEKRLVDRVLELRAALRRDAVDATASSAGDGAAIAAAAGAAVTETATRAPAAVATAPAMGDEQRAARLGELRSLQRDLAELQGDAPLLLPAVDAAAVAAVVADWTGIPVGRMVRDEVEAVLALGQTLGERVVGQQHALDAIARRVRTSRAGLEDPHKPVGVFLLAGPSGVGKTETALALAESLYGGEHNLITINMSEFQEAHTVSTLKGAPPGYVGYGEGGVLTEAVRRRPYSVVLLDEVEKAHPDVHEIFFQVFDKGAMEDGEGRRIDFRNTLILLTSNVGSDLIARACRGQVARPDPATLADVVRDPLRQVFPAALLGRLVVVPYYPLDDETLGRIVRLQLGRVARRVDDSHGVPFEWDDAVVEQIAARCTEVESGGRMIDGILTNTLLPRISEELLARTAAGGAVERIRVAVADGGFTYAFD